MKEKRIQMANIMVKEHYMHLMVMYIQVNGKMGNFMVREFINLVMVKGVTLDLLILGLLKDLEEQRNIQMVLYMLAHLKAV
jgi:hypothetical protein